MTEILKRPIISEKSEFFIENNNTYTFEVDKRATKVDIKKAVETMYGVTVKQDWNSTTYSDKGYVFLMIDLKDVDNPIIHVRTWDEKDSFNIKSFPIGDFN